MLFAAKPEMVNVKPTPLYSSVDPKERYSCFTPHPQCLFASVFGRPGNGSCVDEARLFGDSLPRLAGFAHTHH
jgi:hypothetical protein